MNNMVTPIASLAPGVWQGISNADYHGDRSAVSSSGLKHLLQSPAHFVAAMSSAHAETDAMRFGTALHAALLEPDIFAGTYRVMPVMDKRTAAGKQAAEEFLARHQNHELISQDWQDDIQAMVAAAKRHGAVVNMLASGAAEETYVWSDPETGVLLKCRPDWENPDAIWDVKSCADGSPRGFAKACANYHYPLSAALYIEGVFRCTGETLPFRFIAMEKGAARAVAVYEGTASFLKLGRKQMRHAINLLAKCKESGVWPGYQTGGEIETIELPGWANF